MIFLFFILKQKRLVDRLQRKQKHNFKQFWHFFSVGWISSARSTSTNDRIPGKHLRKWMRQFVSEQCLLQFGPKRSVRSVEISKRLHKSRHKQYYSILNRILFSILK